MVWFAPPEATEVEETAQDDLTEAAVVSERYFDISGAEHNSPFPGMNIILQQLSDGSTRTVKVMR